MKAILFTILLFGVVISSYGQDQYATTTHGRKVILKSNGTWEYLTSPNTNSNQATAKSSLKSPPSKVQKSTTTSKRTYIRGPRGGCYYINKNGGKTYVDRSLCN